VTAPDRPAREEDRGAVKRVLVVEDSATQAHLAKIILEGQGYRVTIARDGEEGLRLARELWGRQEVDLVVSDVTMPKLEGTEMCRLLKADSATRHLPVILLTNRIEIDDKVEGFDAGADDYLTKPYDNRELVARVRAALRVRDLERQVLALNRGLEAKVEERTRELQDANRTLEERNDELAEANLRIKEADRLKSEFLANMSHELRTPLNAVIGFSEILEARDFGDLNAKQERYVGNILSSGKHLLRLINDILDLSKVEAGKMDLHPQEFSLNGAIEDVVNVLQTLVQRKSQDLEARVPPRLNLVADEGKVKQILYNLLSNAIKFTPEKGAVSIVVKVRDDAVSIAVTDTGVGIRKEDLPRLFHAFQQLDGSHSRQYEGTGLGLALTKRFAELHGGRVEVKSAPGQGSTFTVILPRKPQPRAAQIPADEVLRDLGVRAVQDASRTILVAEDDPKTRELLTLYLNQGGYQVVLAGDGEEAVRLARETSPLAITLDVMLPGRDGFQTLHALKADPATRDIPVMMLSIVEDKQLAFSLGAADYLVKPVQRDTLLSRLARFGFHPPTDNVRVLVVDDNPQAIELITDILAPEGFEVLTAPDGKAGLALALKELPDLLILDLMMPGMDGFEVVQRLKDDPRGREIPIFVVTAKDVTARDLQQLRGKIASIVQKGTLNPESLLRDLRELQTVNQRLARRGRKGGG
jgi:DNA-binding response OmpR family regulator/anti-sigma regulatory factor (Ser/Thr protein kinase)